MAKVEESRIDVSKNGPTTRAEQGTKELICRTVRLEGLTEIMFDRYPGDNDTKLEPWQKLYFGQDNKTLVIPSENIMSFLSGQNTDSAPKRLLDARKYKRFANACSSFVSINPSLIPLLREGVPIQFGKMVKEVDPQSGVYIKRHVARLEKGIPNPKVRPVLPMPWGMEFKLTLYPNKELQEQQLMNVFSDGGIAVGLGTFRGQYGKFKITYWE